MLFSKKNPERPALFEMRWVCWNIRSYAPWGVRKSPRALR
jgi:hypothetical protein